MLNWLATQYPMLRARAEAEFGPAEPGWPMPTLDQSDRGPLLHRSASDDLTIFLHSNIGSRDQGIFQLAHETVHTLAPSRGPIAKTIEEGCAVWFSLNSVAYMWDQHAAANKAVIYTDPVMVNYRDALIAIEDLIKIDVGAIRSLRALRPRFEDFDPDFIVRALPDVPEELSIRLCEVRQMRPWII